MKLEEIFKQVQTGELSIEAALERTRGGDASDADHALTGFEDLDFARLDTARAERRGFPETIFCPGKSDEQIVRILSRFSESESLVLASRATPEQFTAVRAVLPRARY
ncbi:MAG: hypothetical protein RIF32_07500, partial [Leptospirales bacterium]